MGAFIDGFLKKKNSLKRLTHFNKTSRSFNWFLIAGREKIFPFDVQTLRSSCESQVESCHSRSRLSVSKPDTTLHEL